MGWEMELLSIEDCDPIVVAGDELFRATKADGGGIGRVDVSDDAVEADWKYPCRDGKSDGVGCRGGVLDPDRLDAPDALLPLSLCFGGWDGGVKFDIDGPRVEVDMSDATETGWWMLDEDCCVSSCR